MSAETNKPPRFHAPTPDQQDRWCRALRYISIPNAPYYRADGNEEKSLFARGLVANEFGAWGKLVITDAGREFLEKWGEA